MDTCSSIIGRTYAGQWPCCYLIIATIHIYKRHDKLHLASVSLIWVFVFCINLFIHRRRLQVIGDAKFRGAYGRRGAKRWRFSLRLSKALSSRSKWNLTTTYESPFPLSLVMHVYVTRNVYMYAGCVGFWLVDVLSDWRVTRVFEFFFSVLLVGISYR